MMATMSLALTPYEGAHVKSYHPPSSNTFNANLSVNMLGNEAGRKYSLGQNCIQYL